MKAKVEETVGREVKDRELEAEGGVENIDGKAQEKIGEIKSRWILLTITNRSSINNSECCVGTDN
jgi:hypothetical protein